MGRTILRTGLWGLLAIVLLAQDSDLSFQSATSLVLVPFNVERGKYYAEDLQPSDFVLRENGKPRDFTIFEGPHTDHPLPLEIDLLFDASVVPKLKNTNIFSTWNARNVYEFLNDWDEEITRDILHQNGMDIRLGVYHYEANQWERLCAATSDPKAVVSSLHRILDPIPDGTGQLTLLPNSKIQPGLINGSPGWLEEATAATLRDAIGSPGRARRILIWFSKGGSGHLGLHTDLLASQAMAAGITINPVIVDFGADQVFTGSAAGSYSVPAQMGDGTTRFVSAPLSGNIGEMTGGQLFVRSHLNRDSLAGILESIRNKALSGYLVGFAPDKSGKPRKHDLEVTVISKDKGRLVGGRRSDVVY